MLDILFSFVLTWILAAVVLVVVDRLNIGMTVGSFTRAIIAAFVIAVLNLIVGNILRLLALPINLITLFCFSWIINWVIAAIVLYLAAKIVKGFEIANFVSALVVALVLGLIYWGVDWIAGALFG